MNCSHCNKELSAHQEHEVKRRGRNSACCSRKCFFEKLKRFLTRKCEVCGNDFTLAPHRASKMKVCSLQCAGKLSSVRMSLTNPMSNLKTRKKVSKTLKLMKHKPPIRGGNGQPSPVSQQRLFDRLKGFKMEYVVITGGITTKYGKLPNHYKIDIANPKIKLAIEIDGFSHSAIKRKYQDLKKTNFLCSIKWKVLRFTNRQVETDLNGCLKQIKSMTSQLRKTTTSL